MLAVCLPSRFLTLKDVYCTSSSDVLRWGFRLVGTSSNNACCLKGLYANAAWPPVPFPFAKSPSPITKANCIPIFICFRQLQAAMPVHADIRPAEPPDGSSSCQPGLCVRPGTGQRCGNLRPAVGRRAAHRRLPARLHNEKCRVGTSNRPMLVCAKLSSIIDAAAATQTIGMPVGSFHWLSGIKSALHQPELFLFSSPALSFRTHASVAAFC